MNATKAALAEIPAQANLQNRKRMPTVGAIFEEC
jgi:hypothetical protein